MYKPVLHQVPIFFRFSCYSFLVLTKVRTAITFKIRFQLYDEHSQLSDGLLTVLLLSRIAVVSSEGRYQLRQLCDDDDDSMATKPERRTSVQRVRPLLQTTQRVY